MVDEIIEAGGAVITEMPLNWEPRGRDFPRRNRVVSGLSQAVVVVEAARRSGSLITARFALEQGREVFAVPGSPLDPRAEGANDLLRQGAGLCTRSEDVTDALSAAAPRHKPAPGLFGDAAGDAEEPLWDEANLFGAAVPAVPAAPSHYEMEEPRVRLGLATAGNQQAPIPGPERTPVVAARASLADLLSATPVSVDDLVRAAGRPASEVMRELFELELAGSVQRQSNGTVALKPPPPIDE